VLTDVVALVLPGTASFELGVLCEVFGVDRTDDGLPTYDFAVAGMQAGQPIALASGGQQLVPGYGLERAATADLVAVPALPLGLRPPEELLQTLRDAHQRGAWVLSVCSGAFAVGYAGLLDERACTTHWKYTRELAETFPTARLEPDVLYVEDRGVITSAGTAAGIDACLHLVRSEQGSGVANGIARRMVVPPHRDGGQAQYIPEPVAECTSDSLAPLLDWVRDHLAEDLSVERLAAQIHQSPRTFARRFGAEVGTTPHRYVTAQRVAQAEVLLETGDESVDRIAERVGFGTAAVLRHHFARSRRTSPLAYRRTFKRSA
jgi:transcriptional regulator GlxA family with amidase domain